MNFKKLFSYATIVVMMFGFCQSAQAFMIKSGDEINIPKGETINETLLATGQSIMIDGDVKGDIICAGQNIDINGNVDGDVLCAGQNIMIAGSVTGSVRVVGQTVKINGSVGRNITVAGQTVSTDSVIAGEMLFGAQKAIIGGKIEKSVVGAGQSITIAGVIGGDAQFQNNNLTLKNGAAVNGTLVYASDKEAVREEGFGVGAGIARQEPPRRDIAAKILAEEETPQDKIAGKLKGLALNLAVALILIFFFKRFIQKLIMAMRARSGRTLGWGLLILIAGPVAIIATFLTIIGIPLAIIALLLYIAALFSARILAAIAIGEMIGDRFFKNRQISFYWQATIGIILCWTIFALPVIGWLFSGAALVWGLGGLRYLFKKTPAV